MAVDATTSPPLHNSDSNLKLWAREFIGWEVGGPFQLDTVSIAWQHTTEGDAYAAPDVSRDAPRSASQSDSATPREPQSPPDEASTSDLYRIATVRLPLRVQGWWLHRSFDSPIAENEYVRFVDHGFMIRLIALLNTVLSLTFLGVVLVSPREVEDAWRLLALLLMTAVVFMISNAVISAYRVHLRGRIVAAATDEGNGGTPACVATRNIRQRLAKVETAIMVFFALTVTISTQVSSIKACIDIPYDDDQTRDDACRSIQQTDIAAGFFVMLFLRFPQHFLAVITLGAFIRGIVLLTYGEYGWAWTAVRIGAVLIVNALYTVISVSRDTAGRHHFRALVHTHVAIGTLADRHTALAVVVRALVPKALAARVALLQEEAAAEDGMPAARQRDVGRLLKSIKDVSSTATVAVTEAVDYLGFERQLGNHRIAMCGLAHLFTLFDVGTSLFEVDRACVFGDAYVVTAGLVRGSAATAQKLVRFCLWQQQLDETEILSLRSCVASGPLSGGVVGSAASLRYQVGGEALAGALQGIANAPTNAVVVCSVTWKMIGGAASHNNRQAARALDLESNPDSAADSAATTWHTVSAEDVCNTAWATREQPPDAASSGTGAAGESLARGALLERVAARKRHAEPEGTIRGVPAHLPAPEHQQSGLTVTGADSTSTDSAADDGSLEEGKCRTEWFKFADPEVEQAYQNCDHRRSLASAGAIMLAVIALVWASDLATGARPLGASASVDTAAASWWCRLLLPIVCTALTSAGVLLARWDTLKAACGRRVVDFDTALDDSTDDNGDDLTATNDSARRASQLAHACFVAAVVCISAWLWVLPGNFARYQVTSFPSLLAPVLSAHVLRGLRFWWIAIAATLLVSPPAFKYGWNERMLLHQMFFACTATLYAFTYTTSSRTRFATRYAASHRLAALGRVTTRLRELCDGLMPPHVVKTGLGDAAHEALRRRVTTAPDFASSVIARGADGAHDVAAALAAFDGVLRGDYGEVPLDSFSWLCCAHIRVIPLHRGTGYGDNAAHPSRTSSMVLPTAAEAAAQTMRRASSPLDVLWPHVEAVMAESNAATMTTRRRPRRLADEAPGGNPLLRRPDDANARSMDSFVPVAIVGGDSTGVEGAPAAAPDAPVKQPVTSELEEMWASEAPGLFRNTKVAGGAFGLNDYDPNTSHVRLFRALHDTLVVGGPLHERAHRQASALAAANVARFVALLAPRARALGFRLAVAFAVEEAAGALVGRGTMRYALSGPALRFAERLGGAAELAAEVPATLADAAASGSAAPQSKQRPAAICYMTRHFRDLMGVAHLMHTHLNVPMGFDVTPFTDGAVPFAGQALADRHIGVARPLMCVIDADEGSAAHRVSPC